VVIDLEEAEARIRAAVAPMPVADRRRLLEAIMLPPDERAAAIGRLYRETDGGQLAEFLIDLEEDRTIALIVADVLKPCPERAELPDTLAGIGTPASRGSRVPPRTGPRTRSRPPRRRTMTCGVGGRA
jgi:hypothetical protein